MGNRVIKKITMESKVAFFVDENHVEKAKENSENPKTSKVPRININAKTVGNNCVPYVKAKKYGKLIKRTPNQNTQMVAALTIIIFKFDKGVNNKLSNVPCSFSFEIIVEPIMMEIRIPTPNTIFKNVIFTSTWASRLNSLKVTKEKAMALSKIERAK